MTLRFGDVSNSDPGSSPSVPTGGIEVLVRVLVVMSDK
jgi:hypothetical protein